MNFEEFSTSFNIKANQNGFTINQREECRLKAKRFFDNNVPVIWSMEHFSLLCGVALDYLMAVAINPRVFYKAYYIPKHRGGYRQINEPVPNVKMAQEWILKHILTPYSKHHVSKHAKAYMPKTSVRDNAKFHRNNKIVVRVDLKDFFGSIHYSSVFKMFEDMGYEKNLAWLLAHLCLLDDSLPQGAPTSPMLSNLIFREYDEEIADFCRRKDGIHYTRYSDDLTFSGDFRIKELFDFLYQLFEHSSFRINKKKNKVMTKSQSQRVTNVIVNQKLQCPRDYRRKIRQEVYYIHKYGLQGHLNRINSNYPPESYIMSMIGKTNYVLSINRKDKAMKSIKAQLWDLMQT